MARHTDTILTKGPAANREAPMVDLSIGGQQGALTDIKNYVSNARYVKRNVIAILVEAPRGFQQLEAPESYVAALKSIIEEHATSIEGLNSTLNVEFSETVLGGSGEQQEDVINVTRERSTPTFVFPEKYGKPIQTLFQTWITQLMMDPETKFPAILASDAGGDVTDLLPDFQSMTVMFIEPDPTHTKVQEAWLCTNMMPKSAGENTGKREIGTGGEGIEHSIEFTAITQVGAGVQTFAQTLLDGMNLSGLNPNTREAFVDAIQADIKDSENNAGYAETLDKAARTAV